MFQPQNHTCFVTLEGEDGPEVQTGSKISSGPHFTSAADSGLAVKGVLGRQNLSRSSVQFSRSIMSDSLRPHESQHSRPPCQSPTPGVHSDSHSSNQGCHAAISSSVVPFSSRPQSLPASESFPMS